jgi:tripartite-type tricarboxylate transporter receptor subunit TctC
MIKALLVCLSFELTNAALAPTYPTRPIRVVVPYALGAPAGAPLDIISKLNGAVPDDREIVENNMTSRGVVRMLMTPEPFAGYLRVESERIAKIVKLSEAKI